jgi:hypothetical protein
MTFPEPPGTYAYVVMDIFDASGFPSADIVLRLQQRPGMLLS